MKSIFIVATFSILGSQCLQTRNNMESHELTTVSDECCVQKGGSLCGKYVKDCCSKGCQNGYFGSQWCKDSSTYNPTDCNTCIKVCKSKGGVVCSAGIFSGTGLQCCKVQNCQGTISKNCKPNTMIDLGQCLKDSKTEIAQAKISH